MIASAMSLLVGFSCYVLLVWFLYQAGRAMQEWLRRSRHNLVVRVQWRVAMYGAPGAWREVPHMSRLALGYLDQHLPTGKEN